MTSQRMEMVLRYANGFLSMREGDKMRKLDEAWMNYSLSLLMVPYDQWHLI